MNKIRRLLAAIESGSVRAFVGQELARAADKDLGYRVDGDALFAWIEHRFEPQNDADRRTRDRLVEFASIANADGGFAVMTAKLRDDLASPKDGQTGSEEDE